MKKIFYCAALAAVLAVSCEKSKNVQPEVYCPGEKAELQLAACLEGHGTKAGYTDAQEYETKISAVQFFVFDAETGVIDKYFTCGSQMKGSVSTSIGKKKVWAIANPPEEYNYVASETELKAITVGLGDNSISGKWFVMAGSKEVDLEAGGSSVAIDISRLAARVCLRKVAVNLPAMYQNVELSYVYLSNVAEFVTFGLSQNTDYWVNWQGRNASQQIDGDTVEASCPELTAHKPAVTIENFDAYQPDTPLLMYAMPNSSTVDPSGYDTGVKSLRTVLVAVVKINGKKYYYPVVLNSAPIESNVSYSVSMTIASLGSDDPNKPLEKSALEVELNIEPWAAGAEYNEVI